MLKVALLLVALPLAAGSLPGSRSWRVTLAVHAGPDSAAIARLLAATYRGELETAVDEEGTFLIALTEAAAALLAADPNVQSVQIEVPEAVSSVRTPAVVANGSTAWSLGRYLYDGAGNINKIDAAPFVYDSTNRLVSGTAGGKTEQYTYDEFGNILTITTSGSPIRRLGVDPDSNRMDQTTGIVGGQSVTYDMTAGYGAAGNVTSHLLDRFQYDGLDVLTKAYVASKWRSYVYNASDERIAVIERSAEFGGETRSDWTLRDAAGQVLRRLSREAGQWQWNQDYIYRGGQMLASDVAGPAKRYHYHLDHLGTPRLITGNGGVEISRHTYLPFGTEVGAIAGQNPQDGEWKKFTGHERDQGSIDYMHARYYNPSMGRFLSVDPEMDPEKITHEPQQWNRYSYVVNNPLKYADPDGKDKFMAWLLGDAFRDVSTWTALKGALSPGGMMTAINEGGQEWADDHRAATHGLSPVPTSKTEVGMQMMMMGPVGKFVGTSFGKLGTVVESQAAKITGFTRHGMNQVINRGVTPAMLKSATSNPTVVLAQSGGNKLFLTSEGAVVLNKSGQVVTAYTKKEFQQKILDVLDAASRAIVK